MKRLLLILLMITMSGCATCDRPQTYVEKEIEALWDAWDDAQYADTREEK